MKRQLITEDKPLVILTSVFPEYTREGIGIDNVHIILTRRGNATLRVNFDKIEQKPNNVVILYPGDVVMVENHSPDFEIEYLVFSKAIEQDVLSGIEYVDYYGGISQFRSLDSPQMAQVTDALFVMLSAGLIPNMPKESHYVTLMLLRSYLVTWQSMLVENGFQTGKFKNRREELAYKFIQLLAKNYKESRKVGFYADKLCITSKYLSNIIFAQTGLTAKETIDEYVVMQLRLTLREDNRPITEIVWEYNFPSAAFFCEYFKRHTKETPQAYRYRFV